MSKILVIEDDVTIRDNILDTLEAEGFDVEVAVDGLAGVELIETCAPELIICDILMPKLDGYGVLQYLHANPATASIPFIFLTSRTERADLRRGMELGADDYIPKPFTRSELLSAVETRLRKTVPFLQMRKDLTHVSQSNESKTDMIRIAAHDLRTPIATIGMTIFMLKRVYGDQLPDDVLEKLENIRTASQQMETIINDILSLERIEAASKEHFAESIDLNILVRQEYERYKDQSQKKKQQLELVQSPNSVLVSVDKVELAHAVENLISNAIKYTPEGGRIRIQIKTNSNRVALLVQDNGFGIPDDKQDELFKPFYRVHTKETQDIQGSGLGLHLVKKIVEKNGGEMIFKSAYGKGSLFGFRLPTVSGH